MKRNKDDLSKMENKLLNSSKKIHQILENDSPTKIFKGNLGKKKLSISTEKFLRSSEDFTLKKHEKIKEFLKKEKEQNAIRINSHSNHLLLEKMYEKLAKRIENEDVLEPITKEDTKIDEIYAMLNKFNIQDPTLLQLIFKAISKPNHEIIDILFKKGFLTNLEPTVILGFINCFKKFIRMNKDFYGGLSKREGSHDKAHDKSLDKLFSPSVDSNSVLLSRKYFEKKFGDIERFSSHGEMLYSLHKPKNLEKKIEKSLLLLSNSKLEEDSPLNSQRRRSLLGQSNSRRYQNTESLERLYSLHAEIAEKKEMKRISLIAQNEHKLLEECSFKPRINVRNSSDSRRSCNDINGFTEYKERIKRATLKETQKTNAFLNLGKVRPLSKKRK